MTELKSDIVVRSTMVLAYIAAFNENALAFEDTPLTAAFNVAITGNFYSLGGVIVINMLPDKLDFIVPLGLLGSMVYKLYKS
jgi:hypothetical protein